MPVILQPRDIDVLRSFASYFMMNSRQVRELHFPADKSGRATRRRLTLLSREGYLRKRRMFVVNQEDGSASPVYHLDKCGREFLAGHDDDDTYLLLPVEPSQPQHLYHYVAVTETHRLFDAAIQSATDDVSLPRWHNEDEVINPHVEDRQERRHLRTDFCESPKVVCIPDAGFLLEYGGHRIVVYLEQDRDTFFHDRVAARKSRGYEQLLAVRGHRAHFPETTLDFFYVLFMTPTQRRADQLRRAFAKRNADKEVGKVYRFGSFDVVNEHNLLFDAVLSCCHQDDRVPLIRRV